MSISTPFIQRPIATSLLMAGIFLIGLVAFPLLPVAPLPQVDFPTIQVTAQLPGANPETMASSVATPLENQFGAIPGVSQMSSTSTLGTSQITVQFDLDRNIDAAAQDIQAAIDAAGGKLPRNLPSPPTYKKVNPADSAILILAVHSDVLPITDVDDIAENQIAQQISRIPGVSQVNLGGQQKPAVRVQIDPAKLAALGMQLEDIAGVISNASVNEPKGAINGPEHNFAIYDNDQLTQAAPWNDVIVAYRNGAPVRIRDIGVAVDGPENNQLAAWQNGRPGIMLQIFKQPGANIIDTVSADRRAAAADPAVGAAFHQSGSADRSHADHQGVRARRGVHVADHGCARRRGDLPVSAERVGDRHSGADGAAVAARYVGGDVRASATASTTFRLMALTIAVGFVVDDAIVMLENIYRHIEEGMSPKEAALKGAGEIGFTILSISLSLVAVFIPLLLMGGIIGRLFREFAVTVTVTIVVSAFVSLTLVADTGRVVPAE